MHKAAEYNCVDVAEVLISAGAYVHARSIVSTARAHSNFHMMFAIWL